MTQTSRKFLLIPFAFLCVVVAALLAVRDLSNAPLPPTVRVVQDGSRGKELQVPIVHYRSRGLTGEVEVDFVGAVHLGEPSYYRDLNERFRTYDVVLYELIADPGAVMMMGTKGSKSTLGFIQRALADLLGLSFQLDQVNYLAPNFVHADLTPAGLQAAMRARGETLVTLLWRIFKLSGDPEFQEALKEAGFDESGLDGINPVTIALRGPTERDRKKLREFMAHGLAGSEKVMEVLSGEMGSAIITDRNRAALDVLKAQIAKGKRRIAIFYGAAHLPDMNKTLEREFELERAGVEWVTAWDL